MAVISSNIKKAISTKFGAKPVGSPSTEIKPTCKGKEITVKTKSPATKNTMDHKRVLGKALLILRDFL